jgi:hypothetical protein
LRNSEFQDSEYERFAQRYVSVGARIAIPASDFLIPRFGILATGKYDEPNSPGEGTRPTITTAFVGRVPSPGVSLIFRGIRKSEDRLLIRTCFAAQVRPHDIPLNSAVAGPCPMIKRNKQ